MVFRVKKDVCMKPGRIRRKKDGLRNCSNGASKSPREKSIVKVTSCILKRPAALELSPTDSAAYT